MTTPRKSRNTTPDTAPEATENPAPAEDSTPGSEASPTVDTAPTTETAPTGDATDNAGKDTTEPAMVTLATPPFTSEFHVQGHIITTEGTKVPASEEEEVRTAALRSGIALREIQ